MDREWCIEDPTEDDLKGCDAPEPVSDHGEYDPETDEDNVADEESA